jgi:hypothetical protein
MLKPAGIELHPGLRVLVGAGLVALALALDGAVPMLVIGGALVVWGAFALVAARVRR